VATGKVMAADLSQRLGWTSNENVACTKKIILRANLPISRPQIPLDDVLGYMAHDKKVINGQLRLMLLKQ
ncbi:3-dehydroquinate synthase, partial [Acinetobacter baumannii]